jgi:hypothetical protein
VTHRRKEIEQKGREKRRREKSLLPIVERDRGPSSHVEG